MKPIIFEKEWRYITDKSVPGIKPLYYMVSNYGEIYSIISNRLMLQVSSWNGYRRVCLRLKNNTSRYFLVHRIVMIEFSDDYSNNKQVNHYNGNKDDNSYANLEWLSASENIKHAYDHGLKKQYNGEDCSWSTINNQQAEQIAKLLISKKYTHQQIADIIGCSLSVVRNISSCSNWKNICEKYNIENYKKKRVLNFSDDELNKLCKYFEQNKCKYKTNSDLYRAALNDIFNMEYNDQSMSATLSRIINKQIRKDITTKYNF